MSDRLTEIEAREQAATRGPWLAEAAQDGNSRCDIETGDGETVIADWVRWADGEFIAHARADVPWLVAQVRERDAEIARLRAEAAGHGSLLRTVLESRGRAEDDSDAAHRRAEKAEAEAARLREALADLIPHAHTVASDRARRRAAELLEREAPDA